MNECRENNVLAKSVNILIIRNRILFINNCFIIESSKLGAGADDYMGYPLFSGIKNEKKRN